MGDGVVEWSKASVATQPMSAQFLGHGRHFSSGKSRCPLSAKPNAHVFPPPTNIKTYKTNTSNGHIDAGLKIKKKN